MQKIEALLTRTIGLDTSSLGATVLKSAVERRQLALGMKDLSRYASECDRSGVELQALIEEVVVGESWFLRHPQSFALLATHAETTLKDRPVGPYRVATVPCAGGEEPYSVLLTFLRAGLPIDRVTVDAADVSGVALRKARLGIYGERAVRAIPPDWRARFFEPVDGGLRVRVEFAQRVQWFQFNLLDESAPPLAGPYDAVFCRNLLIYLSPNARARVLDRVDSWLAPRGVLFLGHAERLETLEGRFQRIDHNGAFAYQRLAPAEPPPQAPARKHSPAPKRATATHVTAKPAPQPKSKAAPKSTKPKPPVAADPLADAKTHANAGRLDQAIRACEKHISQRGPTSEAYHVMGMALQAQDKLPEARAALERAVYLDPHCEPSLLALALIARRAGDAAGAKRLEDRARRASQRNSPNAKARES